MGRIRKDEVMDAARGRWFEILTHFTGCDAHQLDGKHGPCPSCGGKDRFRYDDRNGLGDYICGQCGAGTGIDLVMKCTGWDFIDALKQIASFLGFDIGPDRAPPPVRTPAMIESGKKPKRAKKKTPIVPVPTSAPNPSFHHFKYGEPSMTWEYADSEGRVLHYIARYDLGEGRKEIIPWTFCNVEDEPAPSWQMKGLSGKGSLYNLPLLFSEPERPVLIVEGEKAASAAESLLGDSVVVTTWTGGTKRIGQVDWTPLTGRRVAIWPDADDDGRRAVTGYLNKNRFIPGLADILGPLAEALSVIEPPEGVAQGWDIADALAEGWGKKQVVEHINKSKSEPVSARPDFSEDGLEARPLSGADPDDAPDPAPSDDSGKIISKLKREIRPLGMDPRGRFLFWPRSSGTVVAKASGGLNKLGLIELINVRFFEKWYATEGSTAWTHAASNAMALCKERGIFDPQRVRGRGAWWDNGRSILHCGDRAFVNGEETRLEDIQESGNVYPRSIPLSGPAEDAMSADEAAELVETARCMRWSRTADAMLVLGWIVLAPICGALRWRPHIWITGQSGAGKTTIVDEFVAPLLGQMSIQVQGSTSEAGIRQALMSDALPIIFDEAESNEKRDVDRVQGVLALMRQASSESGAVQIKGSADGNAMIFRTRSMFCLASIVPGVKQLADENRITMLSLVVNRSEPKATTDAKWDELRKRLDRINHETGERLLARSVRMLGTIRENAETLARVCSSRFGGQRAGDQTGYLLAGAYSLQSTKRLSIAEAEDFVDSLEWDRDDFVEDVPEELRCLSRIMSQQVRVDGHPFHQAHTATIGELIYACKNPDFVKTTEFGQGVPDEEKRRARETVLARYGIKMDYPHHFYVANRNAQIERALEETQWGANWRVILRRIEQAEASKNAIRFGQNVRTRAVRIPLYHVLGGDLGEAEEMLEMGFGDDSSVL